MCISDIWNEIDIDKILQNEIKYAECSNNNVDPEIYFHVILLSVFHQFILQTLDKFNHFFGPRLMFLLVGDEKYGDKVAAVIVDNVEKDKQKWLKLVVDHIADTGIYGGNIKYRNIQDMINEDIYDGPLKYLAETPRGKEIYGGLKHFRLKGGVLLVAKPSDITAALCTQILRFWDQVISSFVCNYIYVSLCCIFCIHTYTVCRTLSWCW